MSRPLGMPWRHPKEPCVYILASERDGVLNIGMTSEIFGRVALHKQGLLDGVTKKYRVHHLVYVEFHDTMNAAISREKRLKKWNRGWKVRLIKKASPEWQELWTESGMILSHASNGQALPSGNEEPPR